ncbi:MAG: PAS domain S-box protein, partial [Chitinophagaceae bacterium]|nr:PAS domain S-box protein [Chitinophagaceae bacterium]
DTEQRWFLLRVTNFAGNEPKVVLVHINITERKKAEEALEQSNKRYELVAKTTSDMIWDWDLITGKVYRSKEGWEEIFKENGDKERGTEEDWELKIHPDDRERINLIKQEVFHSKGRDFFEIECRVLRGDGTYAHIHDKGYIIRNEEGKAIRLVGASSDITQKKLAEEELRSSEERYRHLFNNNPQSIFIWDADDYKILEVNDTAVQEYGYQREEFVQLTTLDLRPPQEFERFKAFAKQMSQEPAKNRGVWRHLNKAGEEMFMSIVSDQIAYRNKTAILAIADNVTEKIKLQSKLESERELKEQEINEAALLAQENERQEIGRELHDHINQLLATSRLYLGMLKKEKGSSPLMDETDNLICSAITDIRSLSHSLIAPAISESALEAIMNDIIERIAATTEITIQKNFSGFNENSITDKLKLAIYRIAQEQFNNIIKHAGAKNVYLGLQEERNGIQLIIKDDGVGFDIKQRSAGVGLLNIRTRASLFNGEVSILSSPGNGCELNIFFPVSNN